MTLSHVRSTAVLEALAACGEGEVAFLPGGGNSGDALINLGAYRLFEAAGVQPIVLDPLDPQAVPSADIMVLSGGGGLVPQWRHAGRMLDVALRRSRRVIVMPQTIVGHQDLLRRMRANDILFVRDEESFERCHNLKLGCVVDIDHDVALNVDPELLRGDPSFSLRLTAFQMWHRFQRLGSGELRAWRSDAESMAGGRRWLLNDVSRVGGVTRGTFPESTSVARALANLLAGYERVVTDRLHVLIACTLLGIPVTAHDNANGKVFGVARWSLAKELATGQVELDSGPAIDARRWVSD